MCRKQFVYIINNKLPSLSSAPSSAMACHASRSSGAARYPPTKGQETKILPLKRCREGKLASNTFLFAVVNSLGACSVNLHYYNGSVFHNEWPPCSCCYNCKKKCNDKPTTKTGFSKLANLAAANKYYRLVGMSMEWTHFLELSERKWSQLL